MERASTQVNPTGGDPALRHETDMLECAEWIEYMTEMAGDDQIPFCHVKISDST